MLGEPYRITAVGAADRVIRVSRPQRKYWLSTAAHMGTDGGMELACRKFDTICAEVGMKGPAFIKMDVEGAEMDVLKGAEAILRDGAGLLIESQVRAMPGPKFLEI